MPISPQIRNNWVATQRKFDYPVNAIGVKIKPEDAKTMQVWRDEKIDEDGRVTALLQSSAKPIEKAHKAKPKKPEGQVLKYRGVPIR